MKISVPHEGHGAAQGVGADRRQPLQRRDAGQACGVAVLGFLVCWLAEVHGPSLRDVVTGPKTPHWSSAAALLTPYCLTKKKAVDVSSRARILLGGDRARLAAMVPALPDRFDDAFFGKLGRSSWCGNARPFGPPRHPKKTCRVKTANETISPHFFP